MGRTRNAYLMLGFLGAVALGAAVAPEREAGVATSCPACDVDRCPKAPRECSHGLVKDECGCCKEGVCLLMEKEKCLNLKLFGSIAETELKKLSVCGAHMECLSRTDLKAGEAEESVCQCSSRETSCGRDNVTYPSICRLLEAGTELRHPGACRAPPEVATESEAASAAENERFSLSCEAKGFPVPRVRWEFEGLNGLFGSLPGDDPSVAVHSRGGPEPLTVTSWVMVEALRATDAGSYICVAESSEGVARSGVSVHVRRKNL